MTDYSPLYAAIDKLSQQERPVVVAIDGMAASGKTTLSALLSSRYQAPIVHMDDFFLRPEQRTAKRYATIGENIDYERFLAEVAPHLKSGEGFTYRRFDCSAMSLGKSVSVPPHSILIVEGSYSLRPEFLPFYSLKVMLKISEKEQLSRIEKRNGKEKLEIFREKWIPMENQYFSAYSIEATADFVFFG